MNTSYTQEIKMSIAHILIFLRCLIAYMICINGVQMYE